MPPPSIPPARGGKIELLPLDGGEPGGGEIRMGYIISIMMGILRYQLQFLSIQLTINE